MAATFKGGSTTLEKRKVTYGVDGQIDCEITYTGSESELQKIRPQTGSMITADNSGNVVTVQSVDLETHANGPFCRLNIKGSNRTTTGSGNSSGSANSTVYERSFQRIEKDIRTHRAWQPDGSLNLGDTPSEVSAALQEIQNALDATRAGKPLPAAITGNSFQLYYRLAKGETNYPVWVPIAKKTSYNTSSTISIPVGTISTPPTQCGMPEKTALDKDYQYVLMSDESSREVGKPWRRTQEWAGFDDIDTLLYRNA
jgi:hypothetical protein